MISPFHVIYISTHSLTRRLTLLLLLVMLDDLHFNSQPHEEADNYHNYSDDSVLHFNSQPHEEADPI